MTIQDEHNAKARALAALMAMRDAAKDADARAILNARIGDEMRELRAIEARMWEAHHANT